MGYAFALREREFIGSNRQPFIELQGIAIDDLPIVLMRQRDCELDYSSVAAEPVSGQKRAYL